MGSPAKAPFESTGFSSALLFWWGLFTLQCFFLSKPMKARNDLHCPHPPAFFHFFPHYLYYLI
jgi:hypothetical protein